MPLRVLVVQSEVGLFTRVYKLLADTLHDQVQYIHLNSTYNAINESVVRDNDIDTYQYLFKIKHETLYRRHLFGMNVTLTDKLS